MTDCPGPTDSWVTLAGIARETVHDPARHAGHLGDVPLSRPAGDLGGPGRRDERGPGRLRDRRGLVRGRAPGLRHPVPARSASGSTGWRSSSTSSPGCGPRRPGRPSTTPARTTRSRTPPRCPNRCRSRTRRSSSAAAAPSAPRRWPRGSPRSSTSPSRRWTSSSPSTAGSRAALQRPAATPDDIVYSAAFVVCAGRDDAEISRGGPRRSSRERRRAARQHSAGRHARRDRRPVGAVRRGRRAAGVPAAARSVRPRPRRVVRHRGGPPARLIAESCIRPGKAFSIRSHAEVGPRRSHGLFRGEAEGVETSRTQPRRPSGIRSAPIPTSPIRASRRAPRRSTTTWTRQPTPPCPRSPSRRVSTRSPPTRSGSRNGPGTARSRRRSRSRRSARRWSRCWWPRCCWCRWIRVIPEGPRTPRRRP